MSGAKSVAKKICKKILGAPFKISRQVPGDELEPGPFDGFWYWPTKESLLSKKLILFVLKIKMWNKFNTWNLNVAGVKRIRYE